MTTASGTEIVKQVVIKELVVFESTIKNFRVLAQHLPPILPIDGLIGLDIFRKLKKIISIDFARNEILLK